MITFLAKKKKKLKGKESIRKLDKSRTGNSNFVVAIKSEKMEKNLTVTHFSVHLENGQRIYFTENNFQEILPSPSKMTVVAYFIPV